MNKIKKILTIFVLAVFVFGHALPVRLAVAAPEAPSAPSAPSAPTPDQPSAPEAPKPEAPKAPEAPSLNDDEDKEPEKTPEPKPTSSSTPAPTQQATPKPTSTPTGTTNTAVSQPVSSSTPNPTSTPLPSGNQTGAQTGSGQNGDTKVSTGDATNAAGVVNTGNLNTSADSAANTTSNGPSLAIANTGNGSGSANSGTASVASATTTNQQNSAQVANNVNQTTVTGQNEASKNTGGNTNLSTGDANTTGTIVNNLNTNASGIAIAEFNVEEDYVGDIVLDFAAGCISNCGTGSVNLANSNNGAESTNSANLDMRSERSTFQANDADIENNMTLVADSGNNDASKNTGGNTSIQTGDANVSANVLTFANNNVAGNIVYTAVNVFGDLVGDIIMSPEYIAAAGGCLECGGGDVKLQNSGNGADSDNSLTYTENNENATFQSNEANIENNLIIDATTAGNSASGNTSGDNNIQTGDTNVDANVVNIANANVSGGVWWLVLVNEAGNWVGKLVGGDGNGYMAGSEGTEFIVNDQGEIIAVNSGNGAGSTNTANTTVNNEQTIVQENTANIVNNVNLAANTGNNTANKNTGGDTQIKTGDANVVANIVNFVNNNIVGNGKLFVTVVNVFGSWTGNFITPDATKEEIAQAEQNNAGKGGQQVVEEEITDEESDQAEENDYADEKGDVAATQSKKTKKTAKKNQASPTPAVFAGGNSSNGTRSGGVIASAGTVLGQVAGLKIGPATEMPEGAVVGNNKIKINLAWLVLLLPLLGLLALSRIRIAYYTRKLKEKLGNSKVEGVVLGSLIAALIFLLNRVS